MRIIKYLVLVVHIVTVVVVAAITLSADRMIISQGFLQCEQQANSIFLVEDARSYSVLYKGDSTGVVSNIYTSNLDERGVHIEKFSIADEVYLLEKGKLGYAIKKLSLNDLSTISTSELFTMDDIDKIADFNVNISDNVAYITGIGSGGLKANVYRYNLNNLVSVLEENTSEADTVLSLPLQYSYESRQGTIDVAYFDGSNVITDSPRTTENTLDAYKYARGLNLTLSQGLKINTVIYLIFIAYAIAGGIVIFLVASLIDKRRRFIDIMLINELFILAVMSTILLITGNIIAALIWVVIVSAINVLVILYENRDITVLCEDMRLISSGNLDLIEPRSGAREIQTLWRGINEVKFLYQEYKYIQETTTAAALRFLPHNINTMFKCSSLDELKPGDIVYTQGIMMTLRTQNEITNSLVHLAEEYEKNADGALLSGENSLSEIKMLFSHLDAPVVSEGLNFYSNMADDTACVIYFKDNFKVSIVGTATKSLLNISSAQMSRMEEMSEWFFRMGIKMVISEDVKEESNLNTPLRNIGYCYIEGRKKVFYEVLNAYSESIRASRIKCLEDFDNALSLLYKNDYYLARTAFSDILKIDPTDELARWYLFICEKYLNNPEIVDRSCALDPRN